MKVGVLSDTHITRPEQASDLAESLLDGPFAEVEAILHAGDVVVPDVERAFYPLPWYAARGNMDHSLTDVPISQVVSFEDKQIGLIHGWGSLGNIEQRVMQHFYGQALDVIVFGHSHLPVCRKVGSVLLFNPGSATDRRSAPRHTVGLLQITAGVSVQAEIIPLD